MTAYDTVMTTTQRRLTRREFDRLYREMTGQKDYFNNLVMDLDDLGGNAYGIIARRCTKLTEKEARTVIKAIDCEGIGYEKRSNKLGFIIQQWFGRRSLADLTRNMVMLAPVCCALDRASELGDPNAEMLAAIWWSRENLESVPQGFREALFGPGKRRRNAMLGQAMNAVSDFQMPPEDREWFGANWKKVQPVWDRLCDDGTVNRSRAEALLKGASSIEPSLLDGAL